MQLDPALWKHAAGWFDALVEASASERSEALARLRAQDPQLAGLVQRMLDADASEHGMLDHSLQRAAPTLAWALACEQATADAPASELPDIDGFEILGRLGCGGMGEVFRAERCADGVRQTVALKLLKPGIDSSGELRKRFQRERHILAQLEHPDIARFVDAGVSRDGRPWLAMEFVDGEPICDYARRQGLALRPRVALLLRVARAVAFAQSQRVVHRDIKPSNLLVDAGGRPRLLDFGIAKLLELPGQMQQTLTAVRAFSPAYAAPEQILDETISTATDVYALGLVLYELLTGRLPSARRSGSLQELSRRVLQDTTERPSSVLRAETDGAAPATTATDPRALQREARQVAGDLDLIVLTALQADPARRYRDAEAFANDLENWLEGRPIAARPDSLGYRLQRHAARNPLAAAAVASLLTIGLLGAALGTVYWQSQRGAAVEALAAKAADSAMRIVVLPFAELDTEGGTGFLGGGIADSLSQRFAEIPQLSVIARTSATAYRERDVATIARDLQVGWVLEGSVQRAGDRLRVVARLVRTADQSQAWSLAFERSAGDIFAIQDEIASQVLEALLGAEVLGVARRPSMATSPETYDLFLRGRELWQQREAASVRQAVELLQQAVAQDPAFAPARSELATALYLTPGPRTQKLPQVEAEITQALALDPEDAQAHAVRGLLLLDEERLVDSREALARALELRPNDVNFLGWLANSYNTGGMRPSAARLIRRAYELDTMNLYARTRLISQLQVDEPAEASALARQTVRLFPESELAWSSLVVALQAQGNYEGAVLAAVDALDHLGRRDRFVYAIAAGFNALGDLELADRWRARSPDYRPALMEEFHWLIARGETAPFVDLVEQAIAEQGPLTWLKLIYGRALIGVARYDDAWAVLKPIFEAGPPLDDPGNVSWAQSEIPILVAALAHRRDDLARAAEIEAALQPLIERMGHDWPQGAEELRFFLDVALGRYEQAAARMRRLGPLIPPTFVYAGEHIEWWRPLNATEAGRAFFGEQQREMARQLRRLRASEVPWLLAPETWNAPGGA